MNPLAKVRSAAGSATERIRSGAGRVRAGTGGAASKAGAAPRRAWEGTARTASWIKEGVGRGWERTRSGVGGASADARERVRDAAETAWDRSGGTRLTEGARSNPRVAIAWAAGGLLLIAWIAWTAYVTAEHGANAGLGVLLSWPVVFAALALVAAPFVGAALLVRRLRGGDQPSLAGGGEASASDPEAMTGGTYPG